MPKLKKCAICGKEFLSYRRIDVCSEDSFFQLEILLSIFSPKANKIPPAAFAVSGTFFQCVIILAPSLMASSDSAWSSDCWISFSHPSPLFHQ